MLWPWAIDMLGIVCTAVKKVCNLEILISLKNVTSQGFTYGICNELELFQALVSIKQSFSKADSFCLSNAYFWPLKLYVFVPAVVKGELYSVKDHSFQCVEMHTFSVSFRAFGLVSYYLIRFSRVQALDRLLPMNLQAMYEVFIGIKPKQENRIPSP